jgi:hypothetical protein
MQRWRIHIGLHEQHAGAGTLAQEPRELRGDLRLGVARAGATGHTNHPAAQRRGVAQLCTQLAQLLLGRGRQHVGVRGPGCGRDLVDDARVEPCIALLRARDIVLQRGAKRCFHSHGAIVALKARSCIGCTARAA